MDPKLKALLSHITLIGWIIALVLNMNEKDEFTSFYLRQTLGLYLVAVILSFIPILRWILAIIIFIFWIMSLVASIQGFKKLSPGIGNFFQDLFKGL